jgi:hypothetical protein
MRFGLKSKCVEAKRCLAGRAGTLLLLLGLTIPFFRALAKQNSFSFTTVFVIQEALCITAGCIKSCRFQSVSVSCCTKVTKKNRTTKNHFTTAIFNDSLLCSVVCPALPQGTKIK